jgi:predicted metalloprotease with PDZ domain
MLFTKIKKILVFSVLICAETLIFTFINYAQDLEVKIKLLPQSRISIEGKMLDKALIFNKLNFLENYADVSGIASRIESLKCYDEKNSEIQLKKISQSEFESNQQINSWKYEVKIEISQVVTDAAHVSWISENQGLLMFNDLLPQFSSNDKKISAKISLELPQNWKVSTSEDRINGNSYDVKNIENAVFLVGNNWREKTIQVGKANLNYVTAGDWAFSDHEAAEMINSIISEHKKTFGEIPTVKPQIILLPFPQSNVSADRWRAETRGVTVTIISGVIPQKNVALQRLHEQLRHEIFHLWLPNAVNLSGNYAWFYEGFTIYQSLKTGVELNQIRFEDYLNTLSRAYDIVRRDLNGQNLSLIEASQMRWAGANNYIYAKGLLVAFLCDVAMLRETKGRRSIKDVFRTVYQKHRASAQIQDGNSAITGILKSYPELTSIVQNYIEGRSGIDWREYLEAAGIESESATATQLKVKTNLSGRQKDLLDDLGYNQWRKLLQKKK